VETRISENKNPQGISEEGFFSLKKGSAQSHIRNYFRAKREKEFKRL